jgi:ATP/maltotriose-dependent transcriptional regulator MalT
VFRWSATHLRNASSGGEEAYQRILGATLAFQGLCTQALSATEAWALAHESLSVLRQLPAGKEMIYALQLLAGLSHDETEKAQIIQECLAIARAGQYGWWIPVCMIELSHLAVQRGDTAEARAILEEVLMLADANNYQISFVQAYSALSQIAMLEGKFAEAQSLAQKALAMAEDLGYASAKWGIHSAIADNALLQGDCLTATSHYQIGLTICQELHDGWGAAFELSGLGCAACGLSDHAQARRHFGDAMRSAREVNSRPAIMDILSGIASLLAATGEPARGLELAAYVADQPYLEKITKVRNAHLLHVLETSLAPRTAASAVERGKHLDFDETVGALLEELEQAVPGPPTPAPRHALSDPLTEREIEVLRLISEGLSNYEIAVHLFLGVSTVKTHANRIFSKLCVKNRTQAVARARELHLL